MDPDLQPPTNDEIVAGGEYEILPNARLGVSYTYRNLVRTIEDMSADNGNTYFIGNPGEGIATSFPKATRTYHAVTVQFAKNFSDLWQAQVSYTWSRLRGNYDGLFVHGTGQLDPNINATFDLAQLLVNQDGPLSGDITHTIKVFAAKEFVISPVFSLTLGLTYTGASGLPSATPARPTRPLRPRPGVHPPAWTGRTAPLGEQRRRSGRAELSAEQGQRDHRRRGRVQPLQLPAADRRRQQLHLRHRRAGDQRHPGQRCRSSSAGSAPVPTRRPARRATAICPSRSTPTGRRASSRCPIRPSRQIAPAEPQLGAATLVPAGADPPLRCPLHFLMRPLSTHQGQTMHRLRPWCSLPSSHRSPDARARPTTRASSSAPRSAATR